MKHVKLVQIGNENLRVLNIVVTGAQYYNL